MTQRNFTRALIIGVLLSLLYSCMSDKTALQRVLTKEPLFDTVGQVYTNLHPCNPIVITHHSDTTYLHDTSVITYHDTVGNYIHDTTVRNIRTTQKIHDHDTIVDGQQIAILKSQIQDKDKQIAALNQLATDNRLQTIQEHSRGSYWHLLFWLLIIALVSCVLLYIVKPRI